MDPLAAALTPGNVVLLRLVDGTPESGLVEACAEGWLRLRNRDGMRLIQLSHVAVIIPGEPREDATQVDAARPKPQPQEAPRKVGPKAPGRPWADADMRALADGFLEQLQDGELAERHHRTRHQVTTLRHAFECARGNLNEDDLSPVAHTWVDRWQRVLAG